MKMDVPANSSLDTANYTVTDTVTSEDTQGKMTQHSFFLSTTSSKPSSAITGTSKHPEDTTVKEWLTNTTVSLLSNTSFTDTISNMTTSSTALSSTGEDLTFSEDSSTPTPYLPHYFTKASTTIQTISSDIERTFPGGGHQLGEGVSHDGNSAKLGLLTILVVAVLTNLLVCLAVKLDRRLHHMTYYFLTSLALLHVLMAAVVMPPAILIVLSGEFQYSEEICKLWITLDLFFCNNTCLHLAFANMDSFLRLKDPLRHGRAPSSCSLVLWLGAPWVIALVQGIAQFMLSQADHGIIRHGVCFIADKNFVVLGTLFSFAIPVVIAGVFYAMCVRELRVLRGGKFFDESEASIQNALYHYASNESLADDMSDTGSCISEPEMPHEQVQLAVVGDLHEEAGHSDCTQEGRVHHGTTEVSTSFCESAENSMAQSDNAGQSNLAFADHLLSTDQSSSCTLLLRDANRDTIETAITVRLNAEDDHDSPDETLRHELALTRLMFLLQVACVTLWIPFSVSNVVYGVCPDCRQNMSFDNMMTFKWLAYSCTLIGPFVYAKFCDSLRDAYWNIVCFRYCRLS